MLVVTSSAILKSFDLLALERLKDSSVRLCRLAQGETNNSVCLMDETVPARDDILECLGAGVSSRGARPPGPRKGGRSPR